MDIYKAINEIKAKLANCSQMQESLNKFASPNPAETVTLDLTNVRFVTNIEDYFTDAVRDVITNVEVALIANISMDSLEVDEDMLLKVMWFASHEEHDFYPGPMEALHLLVLFLGWKNDGYMTNVELSKRLYMTSIDKLDFLYDRGLTFRPTFIYNLNSLLEKKELPTDVLVKTIEFCYKIASRYSDFIINLSTCNPQDEANYLAYVCLRTIMVKNYLDREDTNKKQKLIVCVLSSIDGSWIRSAIIRLTVHETLCANNTRFLKQISPCLYSNREDIITAMLNIVKHVPRSKAFALLLIQLPFDMYFTFVETVSNLTRTKYIPYFQMLAYNLLDTRLPGIEEVTQHQYTCQQELVKHLIMVVVGPLNQDDLHIVLNTLTFTDKLLRSRELATREALMSFLASTDEMNVKGILDSIYKSCDKTWDEQRKTVNQYFISVFCNLYLLSGRMSDHSYTQLLIVLENCDIVCLKPCIPVILRVLKTHLLTNEAITKTLSSILLEFAISPSPNYVDYVMGLFQLFFGHVDVIGGYGGIESMKYFITKLNMPDLFKKMVTQKVISVPMFEDTLDLLLMNSAWEIIKIIVIELHITSIPSAMISYWEQRVDTRFFMESHNAMGFITSLLTVLEKKSKNLCPPEVNFFIQVEEFIRTGILRRHFPVVILPFVLVLLNKLIYFMNFDIQWLKEMTNTTEHKLQTQLDQLRESDGMSFSPCVILRDIYYLGEIFFVFGNDNKIVPLRTTIEALVETIPVLRINEEYDEYVEGLLKCGSQISIRRHALVPIMNQKLENVLRLSTVQLKAVVLGCLYDIAQGTSKEFDDLLAHIFEFMASSIQLLRVCGTSYLLKLFEQQYIQLNPWQAYSVVNLLCDTEVRKLCGGLLQIKFFKFNEAHIGGQFIYYVLFFNNLYNLPNFSLSEDELAKIAKHGVAFSDKKAIYGYLLRNMSTHCQLSVVKQLATEVLGNFFKCIPPDNSNLEMLQDIIGIMIVIYKRLSQELEYRKDNQLYEETLHKVENYCLVNRVERRSSTYNEEFDPAIRISLNSLFRIMYQLSTERGKFVFPELFHCVLSITHYLFNQICNILLDDGPESELRNNYGKMRSFYQQHRTLFHDEMKELMLESPSIDWGELYDIKISDRGY